MSYEIYSIDYFDKQLKKLVKKYPSLKIEITELINTLKSQPNKGTPLGNNCYKIRLAVASKGKGKSGGASNYISYHSRRESFFIIYL